MMRREMRKRFGKGGESDVMKGFVIGPDEPFDPLPALLAALAVPLIV